MVILYYDYVGQVMVYLKGVLECIFDMCEVEWVGDLVWLLDLDYWWCLVIDIVVCGLCLLVIV